MQPDRTQRLQPGLRPTVVAAATATRALPHGTESVPAAHVQSAGLATLSDLPGIVVPDHESVPD